ncbi:hypothetical protein BKA70DRAFT_509343 [Coprinopsis sp. MPI-PUGE-AT-0042]|nr:hypothetical protein BKA70DRAFT_509343 [Coprinopsis sp. MPI-PUGE-AT-0042]
MLEVVLVSDLHRKRRTTGTHPPPLPNPSFHPNPTRVIVFKFFQPASVAISSGSLSFIRTLLQRSRRREVLIHLETPQDHPGRSVHEHVEDRSSSWLLSSLNVRWKAQIGAPTSLATLATASAIYEQESADTPSRPPAKPSRRPPYTPSSPSRTILMFCLFSVFSFPAFVSSLDRPRRLPQSRHCYNKKNVSKPKSSIPRVSRASPHRTESTESSIIHSKHPAQQPSSKSTQQPSRREADIDKHQKRPLEKRRVNKDGELDVAQVSCSTTATKSSTRASIRRKRQFNSRGSTRNNKRPSYTCCRHCSVHSVKHPTCSICE